MSAGVVLCLVLMAWATHRRAGLYSDPALIWQDAALKSPLKPRPRLNLARSHQERGNLKMAAWEYGNVLQLSAVRTGQQRIFARQLTAVNLSQMMLASGRMEALKAAEKLLSEVWNEEPGFPGIAINLGSIWIILGKDKMAAELVDQAESRLSAYPWFRDHDKLYYTRAVARQRIGDCAGALADFRRIGLGEDSLQCVRS